MTAAQGGNQNFFIIVNHHWQQEETGARLLDLIFGGTDLEPPLRSGAIALLDLHWLINFALYSNNDDGNNNEKNNSDNPVLLPQ